MCVVFDIELVGDFDFLYVFLGGDGDVGELFYCFVFGGGGID